MESKCLRLSSSEMNFDFATATRIVFGAGKLREAGLLASGFGKHALVVVGKSAARARPLLELLSGQRIAATTFGVADEPTIPLVEQGIATARAAGCDLVIAFGGGSVIDAGKAIAAMLANE